MDKLEIMRSGAWLRAIDPDIGAALLRAEELCFRLNEIGRASCRERV